jgi:spore coat protein U-like protein
MIMRSTSIAPIAAAVLLALAGSAQAANKTTTFGVSASVASNCLVTATNLAFGSYTGVAALTGTSDVGVRCTNGLGYTVKLSSGGGTYATRLLSDAGNNKLQYNLYTSNAYSSTWGDGTSSTAVVTGTGAGMASGSAITHTVYGQLPDNAANQGAPVGSYADTITVTVEY